MSIFSVQAQTLSLLEQFSEAATVLEETIKLFTDSSAAPAPCVHLNLASTYLHLKDSRKVKWWLTALLKDQSLDITRLPQNDIFASIN